MSAKYYIGWDVGAWHCKKNSKSKDAIVILNENTPYSWEGNLKDVINESETSHDFITNLFKLVGEKTIDLHSIKVILAIDAPLGFSDELGRLIHGGLYKSNITEYNTNPYLFRKTEMFLFKNRFKPLSSINDRIGSQTTKAMHVVTKFAHHIQSCGVWTDKERLTIIETYPAACTGISISKKLKESSSDIVDAYKCATIAQLFDNELSKLEKPPSEISEKEGWIWVHKLGKVV